MKDQLGQPRTRRWLFATAGSVAVPAVLAACGTESGPASTGNSGAVTKPVTITYWGRWGGTSEQPEKQVIANFQEKFPNITIQDMESNQIAGEGALDREKFIAALAAGTPPDVIKIDRFKMGGHGAKGTTTILDSVIKRDKIDMKKFFPATVEEVLYPPGSGGKVTALPWNTDDRALYYNKKHFIEAGLDPNKPPKTWEEAEQMGIQLTKRDGGSLTRAGFVAWGANTNWSIGWLWSAGGEWLGKGPDGKENRRAAYNNDTGVKMLTYVKNNMERVLGGKQAYDEWRQRFGPREQGAWFNDGISMGVTGVWELGNFKRYGPHVDFGVAPPPRPKGMEGSPVTWAGGFALAIPTGIKGDNLTAAWEFLKYYCYGKDAQLLFGSQTGQMPALMEAAEDKEYKQSYPQMPVFVDLMKQAKIRDVTPSGDEVWFNTGNNERPFAMFALADRVYEGQMSISGILQESEKYVNQTLQDAWARAGA